MALSTRKKNIIIADWRTGAYSLTSLAKKHKISTNTVKKICTDIPHSNAHLVEVLHEAEVAKNCTKTAQELKSVESVVQNRLKVYDVTNDILDGLQESVKKGKAQKVITEGFGGGTSQGAVIEYDYQPEHYEKAMSTVEKGARVWGVIQDKPDIAIQNNQNNIPQININIENE